MTWFWTRWLEQAEERACLPPIFEALGYLVSGICNSRLVARNRGSFVDNQHERFMFGGLLLGDGKCQGRR